MERIQSLRWKKIDSMNHVRLKKPILVSSRGTDNTRPQDSLDTAIMCERTEWVIVVINQQKIKGYI